MRKVLHAHNDVGTLEVTLAEDRIHIRFAFFDFRESVVMAIPVTDQAMEEEKAVLEDILNAMSERPDQLHS